MHFLEQMKKFIEWLQNAEEGMCACARYAAFVCGFDCLIWTIVRLVASWQTRTALLY